MCSLNETEIKLYMYDNMNNVNYLYQSKDEMNNWSSINWNFIRIWIPNAGADVKCDDRGKSLVASIHRIVCEKPGTDFLACNIFDYENAKQTKKKKRKEEKEKW